MYHPTEGPLSFQWGAFHQQPPGPSAYHPSIVFCTIPSLLLFYFYFILFIFFYFLLLCLCKVFVMFLVWAVWAQHTGPNHFFLNLVSISAPQIGTFKESPARNRVRGNLSTINWNLKQAKILIQKGSRASCVRWLER